MTTPLDLSQCRIVLIEDDRLLRDLLETRLEHLFGPDGCIAFATGLEALTFCRRERPELMIVDLKLPDMDGREIVCALRAERIGTRVIVLTANTSPSLPGELVALGVAGLVDKRSASGDIERAVVTAASGGMYFTSAFAPQESPLVGHRPSPQDVPPSVLTASEREVARLTASGLLAKEIAAHLGLTPRTVEKYRTQIMEKIGARNAIGVVRWCLRNGIE